MQTVQFKIDNNDVGIVLNLLNSLNDLKADVIKGLLIIDDDIEILASFLHEGQKVVDTF